MFHFDLKSKKNLQENLLIISVKYKNLNTRRDLTSTVYNVRENETALVAFINERQHSSNI